MEKISIATVRADFNDPNTVIHYARAANFIGLWASESIVIQRFFPRTNVRLLDAGCGAGRVAVGLWHLGYRDITGFDIAEEPLDQARSLALERCAGAIRFVQADAGHLDDCFLSPDSPDKDPGFDGALFMFNGLMQTPGRDNRRAALRELHRVCRSGATLIFTTHDRENTPAEREFWRIEAGRWIRGEQDMRLIDFGDRYFSDETGSTFMHLPQREEILEDLAAAGWTHVFDAMRREIAVESRAVREFSDECRFWVAKRADAQ